MKRFLTIVLLSFGLVQIALPHAIIIESVENPPVIIFRASYEGAEPVQEGSVSIFSPDSEDEFQIGLTDLHGKFAFVPDQTGKWKIEVDDEFGHRKVEFIQITSNFLQSSKASSERTERNTGSPEVPFLYKILTGLGCIFGITGILYWRKAATLLREHGTES